MITCFRGSFESTHENKNCLCCCYRKWAAFVMSGAINSPVRSRWVRVHCNEWQLKRFLSNPACMEIQSRWSTPTLHTVKGILRYNTSMSLLLYSLPPSASDSEGERTDSISLLLSNHPPCFDLSINNRLSVRACTAQSGRLLQMLYSKGLWPMLQKDWPEWEISFFLHYPPKPSNPRHRHESYRWLRSPRTWNRQAMQ